MEVAGLKHTDRVHDAAFTPDGRLLATAAGRTVRLWDVVAAREIERYDWQVGAVRSVAFSPDGMTAAAAGHKKAIVIWDVGDLAG